MSKSLEELRGEIDHLDSRLVALLNERTRHVLDIGELKKDQEGAVYVPAREKEVFERVEELNGGPLPHEALRAIYREIMSASLSLEHDLTIAYLGPAATFTHQASRAKFGASVNYHACETISDVFKAVQNRAAEYGVVPVENSTEGAVTHTLDEFIDTPTRICAEVYLGINHHMLGNEPRDEIKRLYSNPQVFGQCRAWLQENMPGVQLIPTSSTAKAAELASKEEGSGALASVLAAELYGLEVMAENIQDIHGNTTRFLVIARDYGPATGADKTSVAFTVQHEAGALYEALGTLKKDGLNMSKIESRPSKARAWEYFFFVDIEGHVEDPTVAHALEKLEKHCTMLTVLGSYPRNAEPVQG